MTADDIDKPDVAFQVFQVLYDRPGYRTSVKELAGLVDASETTVRKILMEAKRAGHVQALPVVRTDKPTVSGWGLTALGKGRYRVMVARGALSA